MMRDFNTAIAVMLQNVSLYANFTKRKKIVSEVLDLCCSSECTLSVQCNVHIFCHVKAFLHFLTLVTFWVLLRSCQWQRMRLLTQASINADDL